MLDGVVAEELLNPLVIRGTSTVPFELDKFIQDRIFEIGFVSPLDPIDETADPVVEVFGHTYITQDYFGVWPDPLIDSDTFFAFSYSRVPALSPRAFVDADIFYSVDMVGKALRPNTWFVDTDIFYAPEIKGNVYPGLVVNDDVIRAQIIRRDGDAFVLLTDAFIDDDAFLAANAAWALLPGVVNEHFPLGDVIYPAGQAAFLLPSAFNPGDTFFAPFIFNQLNPSRVLDADVFNGPELRTPGRMGLFADDDIFFVPGVGLAPLAAPFISADDAFITPVIASNPAMYPYDAVIDFADTFYVPDVDINQSLAPHFWPDIDVIMSIPAVILGQALVPAVFVDTDAFYVPVLPPTLSPALFIATDNFFTPILIFDQAVSPNWFIDGDIFPAPSVSQLSSFDGTLALDGPIMPATPQPTVIFIEG
jgi:hypothetical protein